MFNKLLEADSHLSSQLRLPENSKVIRAVAAFFAHSGDSWFWLAGLFIVWLIDHGQLHTMSAFLAASILVSAGIVLAVKFSVRRSRPAGEWGAIYRNTDPHSFPSGHAARAVLLAVICWALGLQPLAWILVIWAPLVSIARVMMGVHYLIDVIAGWLLGLIISLLMLALQPWLYSLFPFPFIR